MLKFKKLVLFSVLAGSIFHSASALAGVAELDVYGLSVHLGSSYSGAPLGLDSMGVVVFNPGIGLGYDFRKTALTTGFSPIVRVGSFQDCNFKPLYFGTAGFRYTYVFAQDYTIGGSASVGLMNGENWWTGERSFSFMPLPVVELGRRIFEDDLLRLGVVFAPKNPAMSATSGGSLLFFMLSYAHSI